jgi:formylglycine-generating enzyme required for sulfatase activity
MSQCLNPDCLHENLREAQFCQKCESKLLLSDRYRALRILGKGGFGRTFLAVDELKPSKPFCVIKQFLPTVTGKKALEKAYQLFEQEAISLDELGQHEQIPSLLAYFSQENRQYLIQEFIDGNNLAEELDTNGVFNEQQIREVLNDMLCVLQYVHSKQIIHRDIKPENIIRRKSDGRLVLVDFGAAKDIDGVDLSITGTVIGSAAYIAPEQAVGKPQFASDLYSLGTTCLHLATNVSPTELFDIAEGEWMWRDYLENNEISYELSRVLDKLVEGATKRRFQSVEEVLSALDSGNSVVTTRVLRSSSQPYSSGQKIATFNPQKQAISSSVNKPKIQPSVAQLNLKIFEFDFVTLIANNSLVLGKKKQLQTKSDRGKAKYITVDLGEGITIDLVGIPGGIFLMGSPENEAERGSEENPQHQVSIRPFLMGKYPVTQAQWQAVMKKNPSRFIDNNSGSCNKPVEKVSWYDCQEFCQKLSAKIGREFRLPSEAEWEYACRTKTRTPFHFGQTIDTRLANYNGEFAYEGGIEGEYRQKTTEVGIFSPNGFGLYDMHGNVAEWCADSWHNNYEGAPTDENSWLSNNPREARVLRGGSWLHLPGCCRSSHRLGAAPDSKSDAFGFRIASSI